MFRRDCMSPKSPSSVLMTLGPNAQLTFGPWCQEYKLGLVCLWPHCIDHSALIPQSAGGSQKRGCNGECPSAWSGCPKDSELGTPLVPDCLCAGSGRQLTMAQELDPCSLCGIPGLYSLSMVPPWPNLGPAPSTSSTGSVHRGWELAINLRCTKCVRTLTTFSNQIVIYTLIVWSFQQNRLGLQERRSLSSSFLASRLWKGLSLV